MERLVVDGWGKYVGKKGNQIIVKEKGTTLHYVLAESLRQVVITGGGSIGFEAMNLLAENGVDLIVINWKGRVTARLSSPEMRTVSTRREQYYAYNDNRGAHLAKNFVVAKIKNQYALLGTWAKTRKDTNPESSDMLMKLREEISNQIPKLEEIKETSIEKIRGTLMGIEGSCSNLFWKGFGDIVPESFQFSERSGRHAEDGVNAMLNYGYALLEGEVHRAIHFAGLDPYGGFLHADRPGKPSLVLDLMEEFRQQLIDKSVMALVQKKVVSPGDFTMKDGMCWLSDSARKTLVTNILEKFEDYMKFKNERVKWCDLILRQARYTAKYLRGETTAYEGFYLRW